MGAQHVLINAWMNYSGLGKHKCPLKEGVRHFYELLIVYLLSSIEENNAECSKQGLNVKTGDGLVLREYFSPHLNLSTSSVINPSLGIDWCGSEYPDTELTNRSPNA